jgi:hypothetical protein
MPGTRRWSERILLLVNLAVANAVAALWIVTFLQPGAIGKEASEVASGAASSYRDVIIALQTPSAWLAFLGSIILLMWNISWLVRRRTRPEEKAWVISDSASGPVRIHREAIESGVRSAGETLPQITRLRVQVLILQSNQVQVTGHFHCAEGQDHLQASEQLRQAMVARFGELVRVSDGVQVEFELEFQGFLGKLDKNAPEPTKPEEEDAVPFRGPQYPIDDDSPATGRNP